MNRSKEIVRVSFIGIGANLVLVAFKALVGVITGSIAVVLDAVNNLSDALSSVITILGTKLANRPPDKKHPYGHGRIEYITSVIIAIIVLLAGLASFRESVDKILRPAQVSYTALSLVIIVAAVAVKFFLGGFVKARGEALNSDSLVASGTDARFDALISLSTLVAGILNLLLQWNIEGWLGAVISIFILKAGIEILMDSLNGIIGERVESELTVKLRGLICSNPQVLGAYDLILHRYGPERTIGSVHIEVDDSLTARELHHLTRALSEQVFQQFGIVLTVGIYASGSDSETASLRRQVNEVTAHFPEVKELHAFYVEPEQKRITFDLVLHFGSDAADVLSAIRAELGQRLPDWQFDIVLDSDFSD